MASVIGNPSPGEGNGNATPAPVCRMVEVWFLDADTFLGPVRAALRAHCAQPDAPEPSFPRRRKVRRAADAAFRR